VTSCIPANSSRPIRCRLSGGPSRPRPYPAPSPGPAVAALLGAVGGHHESSRRTDWAERDLALILTGLLAGLRLDELRRADVGDIRTSTGDGAVIYVRGKSGKDRTVPIEADLLAVIETYLDSRAVRFPGSTRSSTRRGLSRWPSDVPLFVGRDGQRITRGTIQSRVRRAFRRAGSDAQPVRGGTRPRAAAHLRDGTGQLQCQRVHADETPRPRIDGDFTALRRWRRTRNPSRRSPKPALRARSRWAWRFRPAPDNPVSPMTWPTWRATMRVRNLGALAVSQRFLRLSWLPSRFVPRFYARAV
jgi:integrase